jgi:hypothetical protein
MRFNSGFKGLKCLHRVRSNYLRVPYNVQCDKLHKRDLTFSLFMKVYCEIWIKFLNTYYIQFVLQVVDKVYIVLFFLELVSG